MDWSRRPFSSLTSENRLETLASHPQPRIICLANKQVALKLNCTQRVKGFFLIVIPLEDGTTYSFYYLISVRAMNSGVILEGALTNKTGWKRAGLTNGFDEKSNDRLDRSEGRDNNLD